MTTERQAIAQDIRAAFACAESTSSVAPGTTDDAPERTFEDAYAEQPKELATNFLVASASTAGDLPPKSERWLWRSLLLAALQAKWDLYYDDKHPQGKAVHRLLWAAVYHLRPEPIDVLNEHWDYQDAQGFRERLTPAQRIPISRFLALILQSPVFANKPMADMACQAIHWCWSDDPDSSQAAKSHHTALRSFSRPTHDSSHFEERIAAIELAFADTPYPKGPLMTSGWEEPAEYELAFRGTDWRRLTPQLIDHNFTAFCFMTPDAFRYFIPAVLCHLLGPGSMVDSKFHLVDSLVDASSYREEHRQRVHTFSPEERWAIVNFLHFELMCYPHADPQMRDEYEQAMDIWEFS